jgi:RimJ/RimL family protein N-acetyltransferase
MGAVQFYHLDGRDWQGDARLAAARSAAPAYSVRFWRPSLDAPFPTGRRDPRILSYSAMHALGLFANRDYAMVMLAATDGAIAHSSMVMPGFARFPFMAARDLQIGATETAVSYRGQGLAVRAIDEIVDRFGRDRGYWYLTEDTNDASVAVIRKAGFRFAGSGDKCPRFGLRALGFYAITSPSHDTPPTREGKPE